MFALVELTLVLALVLLALRRPLTASLRGRRNYKHVKNFQPEAYGLVPRAELQPDRASAPASPELLARAQAVANAVWARDWKPAAEYLDEAGRDWDERWNRLEFLRQITDDEDTWVDAWRAEQPDSGDAAALHAHLLVHRAWKIRGSALYRDVPRDRMARFQQLLPAAMQAAQDAAAIAPEDPAPWVVMITVARPMRISQTRFRELWSGLVARAPFHVEGHWQALQFWCAKWGGSHELMLKFAATAADAAPEGSPVAGVYLYALHELEAAKVPLPSGSRAVARLDRVRRALNEVPPDDERLPGLRHLLAHYLLQARQFDAALEQFRLIGRWCGAHPWTDAADPVAEFDRARALAAAHSSRPGAE